MSKKRANAQSAKNSSASTRITHETSTDLKAFITELVERFPGKIELYLITQTNVNGDNIVCKTISGNVQPLTITV